MLKIEQHLRRLLREELRSHLLQHFDDSRTTQKHPSRVQHDPCLYDLEKSCLLPPHPDHSHPPLLRDAVLRNYNGAARPSDLRYAKAKPVLDALAYDVTRFADY